jgi:hypothetical protein
MLSRGSRQNKAASRDQPQRGIGNTLVGAKEWRREPESNRPKRICNPLHNRFAIAPSTVLTKKQGKATQLSRKFGAGNEVRTRDLNLGKVALYQLSYSRINVERNYYGC